MSFTLMAKVMPLNMGSLAKKMVLLKLADQASDSGYCWPSYQTIADACQVSRRTVIRHIKSLEDDSYLTITRVYDEANKKNSSNRYQLTIDRGVKMSLVTESHHPSDNVSVSGDRESLPSDRESPKPIIEPAINLSVESISNETKKPKPTKKKKRDIPSDFAATDKQIEKCNEYGINIQELINGFDDFHSSKGNQFVDWSKAFNTWINNHIKFERLKPIKQGDNNANRQSANSQRQQQPKQSSADIYAAKLAEQRRQREAANPTATRSNRANVYDMEENF